MTDNRVPVSLPVKKLFGADDESNARYCIPMYQRNYAWGESEVRQLLQDILDVSREPEKHTWYYIGSLVVDVRDNGVYETIDGQQRHTTLSIILAALQNEFGHKSDEFGCNLNLDFENRDKSSRSLKALFNNRPDACEQASMLEAYEVACRFLDEHKSEVSSFCQYLMNQVIILRVPVPEKTDLNHYFEIMNNRGEQLEKHEVLKARLMSNLSNNDKTVFSTIWDACADMDRYVQLGFKKDLRETIFGADWNQPPENFETIAGAILPSNQVENSTEVEHPKEWLIEEILTLPLVDKTSSTDREEEGKFSSIVNFPNFLLQVLRIRQGRMGNIPLDDKKLLDVFPEASESFAKAFVVDLLKCRMLFDRYIIKRQNDDGWVLKTLTPNNKSFNYVETFKQEKESLVMILSMFHVSYPTQVYKHWLCATLHYLFRCDQPEGFTDKGYLAFLERLNDRFLLALFGEGAGRDYDTLTFENTLPSVEFDMSNLDKVTGIQNFIFNRLDYLLWKGLQGESKDWLSKLKHIDDPAAYLDFVKEKSAKFSFTFRSSVEHYYPQHPKAGKLMDKALLDSFGNLCLISHSENSRANNDLPVQKMELYKTKPSESLKLMFMVAYSHWDADSKDLIIEHQNLMSEILLEMSQ